MTGMASPWHMAEMGVITSLLAPAIILEGRRRWSWSLLSLPAPVALVGFVLLHGAITLGMDSMAAGRVSSLLLHAALLVGAIVFWLPVLAGPHRLDRAGRAVYLFLGAPALDLAGVVVVARGDSVGGLAMIVAMFPIGLAAVWAAWSWINGEEADVRRREAADSADALAADGIPPESPVSEHADAGRPASRTQRVSRPLGHEPDRGG